jgi:hypothetical protein
LRQLNREEVQAETKMRLQLSRGAFRKEMQLTVVKRNTSDN